MSEEKDLEDEIEYYDEETEEYFEDKVVKDSKGQVKFKSVNHSERAMANEVETDGEISTYANYALEYFGYRCALSGEKLVVFDSPIKRERNKKITTNLSAEHIVALSLGGNDIIPNIVPSVLQYNIQKNGYYILDWWPKARDIEGNPIYNEEKLLKLVNYMLKSLAIRKELGIKVRPREYRKRLLTPNEIDEYLESEEIKERLFSDVITSTEEDIDGKKILTKIPEKDGAIPSLSEQKENELKVTEEMFLLDSIELLEKGKRIPQEIVEKLRDLYKEVEGEIPFEIEVRREILRTLEEMGIEDNKYTVASTILINTNLLEQARQNPEEIQNMTKEYLDKQIEELKEILPEEQVKLAISSMPTILYEETTRNRIKFWKEERGGNLEELLHRGADPTDNLVDILIILKRHKIDITKVPNSSKELEDWLRENVRIPEDEIEKILEEIQAKGITKLDMGYMQSHQKNSKNNEKYEKYLKEAKDEEGNSVFTEDEIEKLTSRKQSQDQTQDLVDILIILKQHKIDITKVPNGSKQLEDWLRENVKISEDEIEKILEEIQAKGITKLDIGTMQSSQKKSKNIDKYREYLKEAKDEEGNGVFTEDEIEKLTSRKISQNQIQDLVGMLITLKQHKIDITKVPNNHKELEDWLREKVRIPEDEIEKILEEIQAKGITKSNIGNMQSYTKNRNIEKYEKYLREAKDEEGNGVFTEKEIEELTSRKISRDATQDLVDILIILKQHKIDITKVPNYRTQLEDWLREKVRIPEDEIEKILEEIQAKGITKLDIGYMQSSQKNSKNNEKYEKYLKEAKDEEGNSVFTEDEIKALTSKRKSKAKIKSVISDNKDNLSSALDRGKQLESEIEFVEQMEERGSDNGRE